MNVSSMPESNVRLRCVAFDRFACAVLGTLVLLLVAEHLRPYGPPDLNDLVYINGALCAAALMLSVALAMPLVFVVALLRRNPKRMSLCSLCVFVSCVAIICGLFSTKIDRASRQHQMLQLVDSRLNNFHRYSPWNVARICPAFERMLQDWLGRDFFCYPIILGFGGEVNEEVCWMVGQMPTLECVSFGSGKFNDSWLMHFAGLRNLRSLVLPSPGPSQEAVNRLQRALPECEISWNEAQDARGLGGR